MKYGGSFDKKEDTHTQTQHHWVGLAGTVVRVG